MRFLSSSLGLLATASLALAAPCKPSAPVLFSVTASSTNPSLNGYQFFLNGQSVSFFPPIPGLTQDFYLAAGTNYLTASNGLLIVYNPANSNVDAISPTDPTLAQYINIVCSPAVNGAALSCAPVGLPSVNTYYVQSSVDFDVLVSDHLPSGAIGASLVATPP